MRPRCASVILSLLAVALPHICVATEPPEIRLLFTGDILLSRNVAVELAKRKTSPWERLSALFGKSDLVVGNLEGAVGKHGDCIPCANGNPPCFIISDTLIPFLASAGFKALSVENNHSHDLGDKGRNTTIMALSMCDLVPITFEASPKFFRVRDVTVGLIAINLIPGRDGARLQIPSVELRQKLRLARSLANLVVVSVHWGSELLEWPNQTQRHSAKWLIDHGADLIIGHHPHVVQAPEMIEGKPVFFSLGNHLFDQKYVATKEGLIADCRISAGALNCRGITTHTAENSFYPEFGDEKEFDLKPIQLRDTIRVSGMSLRPVATGGSEKPEISLETARDGNRLWQTRPIPLASIARGRLDGKNEFLLTLERHYSPIDGETGLRPYVYSVTEQGLVAKWRGSALAWPLIDGMLMPGDETILCALHRGDSFIDLQPRSKEVRTMAYRWNGFGFSGVNDPAVEEKCRKCWE